MNRLPPLLVNMAQITPHSRASAALLIAILAVVLFTGPPASGQSENEDLNQVAVSFRDGLYIVDEGGTRAIGVRLSDDPGREVIIPITATGLGGASPADYSGVPQTVTFSREDECFDSDGDIIEDGICYETSKYFTFMAEQDAVDDDGERVLLGFGAPLPAGVSAGWVATETVTITDGAQAFVGLAQVGIGVTADVGNLFGNISNEAWQWQRSATEYGAYSDIPAAEGGTSNPYTPSAGDLGMWLKAKVTFDDGSSTGPDRAGDHAAAGVVASGLVQRGLRLLQRVGLRPRSSPRDSHRAPVRAGIHDRIGHQRLPADGGTPLD